MKVSKLLVVYLLIVWPIIVLFLLAKITGKINISYEGFAIDHNNDIYLGKDSTIEVLDYDGKVLRSISPYTFTITPDNQIKISTGDYLYLTDLSGNLISKKDISSYTDDDLLRENRYEFIASDGVHYIMKNHFLRPCIYRIDETQKTIIYKMPIFDYIVKLIMIACFLSFIIIIPIVILKSRRAIKL